MLEATAGGGSRTRSTKQFAMELFCEISFAPFPAWSGLMQIQDDVCAEKPMAVEQVAG